jgi:holin-like protein
MVFMFTFLLTGIIKLSQVKETGKFLIEIMPVMFIPAGVGLMSSWNVLAPVLLPVSVITVITIFTVMAATGLVSQGIIHRKLKTENDDRVMKEAA